MKSKNKSKVNLFKQNLKQHADWVLTVLLITFFSSLVLGQFQRIQLTPSIAFYVHDLLIVTFLSLLAWLHWQKIFVSIRNFPWKKHTKLLLLIAWIGLGWLLSWFLGRQVLAAGLYFLRYTSYSLFMVALLKTDFLKVVIHGYTHRTTLKLLLVVSNIGILLLGLLQYFLVPDTRFLHIYGWDDHFYRLIGTQFDPNFIGLLFVFFIILLEGLGFLGSKSKWFLRLAIIVAVALTFSRSTYLSFGISMLYLTFYEIFRDKTWLSFKWILLIFLLGVAIVLAPKQAGEGVRLARTSTVISRLDRTDEEISRLSAYDVVMGKGLFVPLNTGVASVEEEVIPNHAWFTDNLFLNIFVSLGTVGVVLLVLVLWQYYPKKTVNALVIALWIALLSHSMFNNSLLQPFVWLLFGLTLGVVGEAPDRVASKSKRNH